MLQNLYKKQCFNVELVLYTLGRLCVFISIMNYNKNINKEFIETWS